MFPPYWKTSVIGGTWSFFQIENLQTRLSNCGVTGTLGLTGLHTGSLRNADAQALPSMSSGGGGCFKGPRVALGVVPTLAIVQMEKVGFGGDKDLSMSSQKALRP